MTGRLGAVRLLASRNADSTDGDRARLGLGRSPRVKIGAADRTTGIIGGLANWPTGIVSGMANWPTRTCYRRRRRSGGVRVVGRPGNRSRRRCGTVGWLADRSWPFNRRSRRRRIVAGLAHRSGARGPNIRNGLANGSTNRRTAIRAWRLGCRQGAHHIGFGGADRAAPRCAWYAIERSR